MKLMAAKEVFQVHINKQRDFFDSFFDKSGYIRFGSFLKVGKPWCMGVIINRYTLVK
jgi:hypothetical protein